MVRENVKVAFDVGPLHGPRTGVGNATVWLYDALTGPDRSDGDGDDERSIEVLPYITSTRARLKSPERRLPIPAAVAMRLWARPLPTRVRGLHERWIGNPDVVHGTNYTAPPTTRPTLISVYDCWVLEHPGEVRPDVRRSAAVLSQAVANGAHLVVSSRATARRVGRLLDTDRVEVIHLGPPPQLPNPPRPLRLNVLGEAPFVVALGTVERRKNYPVLVRAFGRLASECADALLVIAGAPGDDQGAMMRAIDSLGRSAGARVHVMGAVDESTKAWLVNHARALAYPSLDEGFGFPILEAQRADTPVVASTAGSIPEIAGPAALLSPPADAEALAANLHWVMTSDEMHDKLVRRGRSNVERFSWQRTADAMRDRYLALAESAS
jgi:glycosyltransferase involved in cell wall biosynthesis